MIAIDWVFLAGAGSIVGAALIERLADDYGFGWVGRLLKVGLTLVTYGAGLYLINELAVFL